MAFPPGLGKTLYVDDVKPGMRVFVYARGEFGTILRRGEGIKSTIRLDSGHVGQWTCLCEPPLLDRLAAAIGTSNDPS